MELMDLPEEVIIIIISKLDTVSVYNMYNSCIHIRNIICLPRVVQKMQMSRNVLATAHAFKLFFYKDIAINLQELNMCGVPDLKRKLLLPPMKKLKKLITLDVSYTDINIVDLLEIYQTCPTLRNITINFVFGKNGIIPVSNDTITQCQNMFQIFENVHFVGSAINLMHSKLAQCILSKAKLNTLKYSVSECNYEYTVSYDIESQTDSPSTQYKQFNIWLLNWKESIESYQSFRTFPLLSDLSLNMHEFIVIIMLNLYTYSVYASQSFHTFFSENFGIQAVNLTGFDNLLFGNVSIMMWKKDSTDFNEYFFSNLYDEIKQYLPSYCASASETTLEKHNWFYIIPKVPNCDKRLKICGPEFRKRRLAAPSFTLNYDKLFEEQHRLQLSILFQEHIPNPITLKPNSDYLKKLTFLSLCGTMRFSSEFFNILFRSCINLITLNVQAPPVSPCASPISRSLPITRTLKNLRLIDKRIDFKTLFSSLSQCVTLENIHIIEDTDTEHCDIADPSILLQKCDNLYSCYIEAPISKSVRMKKVQMLNKVKQQFEKNYVNVVIHSKIMNDRIRYVYDPFVHVFNLNPIKPI